MSRTERDELVWGRTILFTVRTDAFSFNREPEACARPNRSRLTNALAVKRLILDREQYNG